MIIYKITNKINGKVYIGQTIRTLQHRWKEHQRAAFVENRQTNFARALRKYGIENFIVEVIDHADSREELNDKERYWISYYDSCVKGYNLTDGGDETDTYKYKTEEEMEIIKDKIRITKIGNKNPNARRVKCKNEITKEEYHFDSVVELQSFLNAPNHNGITRRCNNNIGCLYKKIWNIAYEEDNFSNLTSYKNNRKSKRIKVTDCRSNITHTFPSYAEAERFFDLPLKTLSGKAYQHKGAFIVRQRYKVEPVN